MKSLIDVPIRVEMGTVSHTKDKVLSVEDLAIQIEAAKKGTARVDSKYVGNGDGLEHLHDYKYDWARFLDNMSHIIKMGNSNQEQAQQDSHFHDTHKGNDNRKYKGK